MSLLKRNFSIIINIAFFLSLASFSYGQTKDTTKLNIKFNMGVGAVSTEYFSKDIRIDKAIALQRAQFPINSYFTKRLTDQPHDHGAIFANFSTKTSFRPGYVFYANMLLEYRGESYGANDLNNAVVLPQLYGRINDRISIKGHPLHFFLHIGDIFQFKLNQGLQVYNIDVQAMILKFDYRKFRFKIVHLPDVSNGIGLGLEEVVSFNLGYFDHSHQLNFSFDLNSNFPFIIPWSSFYLGNRYYQHLSFDYKYVRSELFNVYAQVGTRNLNDEFSRNSAAFVIGSHFKFIGKYIDVSINPEYRFYTRGYNLGYYEPTAWYRDNKNRSHYSNTVGRYLYPLKNYDYPFNQWAVFTEYQNQDVAGLSVNSDVNIKITKKFGLLFNLEYMRVGAIGAPFNYLFYTWNIYYKPTKDLYIKTLVTNKTMNLDAHYQTFYQTKYPSIGLSLRRTLNPLW